MLAHTHTHTYDRGCFDEFNRISVEVLSVVAVQVKSVQDAIRDKKEIFNFMGEMIRCVPSVGIFITMVMCLPTYSFAP